ncbi:14582_t:CDS:1, partial [Racocetra fulgida]
MTTLLRDTSVKINAPNASYSSDNSTTRSNLAFKLAVGLDTSLNCKKST